MRKLHAVENPRDPDRGPRLAEFSWIWDDPITNHPKHSFDIAIDHTGRYQSPSSFDSLHIMHPTRVLQIQPTRLLLRPVPVSSAISDTFRGDSWHFVERRTQRYELLISSSSKTIKSTIEIWLRFCKAHTISQRLRRLKRIPPELIPLGKSLSI